ncbi:unnamed protein product [Adineta ricciae]|uniref:SAM domain-containing protein n=1 Tax=Adineta ricciae TaxID=249248 RepID=A0A814P6H0_ADIRI|nr:unnamed protein product [Adineta ricciae]
MQRIIVFLVLFVNLFQSCLSHSTIAYNIPDPDCTGPFNLCTDADKERLGRLAVKAIHEQMDDDKDGMIEASESSDFIKEELESNTDAIRHRHFQNADTQITFNDLWSQWQNSIVYNWTTDDVVNWLVNYAHLPMYVENFRRNQFDGRMIPRLAANEKHYLSAIMQIRDLRHKRRLIIKATDVVLFGPPPSTHNLVKDVILITAVLISFGACLYAYIRHRRTQESMNIMVKELETLQKAEGDLACVTGKIKAMENELKDKAKVDRGLLNSWFMEVQDTKEEADRYRKRRGSTVDIEKQIRLAEQEIEQLRIALKKAEEHAKHQSYEPPAELIDLLRRTYNIEEVAFETTRRSAENAMLTAKDQMNKVSKMQKGFFGAVRIAHTGCMDNISELISNAKERLAEVQREYEERERRWNRIAALLNREDLLSNSSPSTSSIGTNQFAAASTAASLNNGSSDSIVRQRQISNDSNGLINTNYDPVTTNKSISNISNRNVSTTALHPEHLSQQELLSLSDSNYDFLNPPSSTLKRRIIGSQVLPASRSSAERVLNSPVTMTSSQSVSGLYDLSSNHSNGTSRHDLPDSAETSSLTKSGKPMFDIDNVDFMLDDQDRRSNVVDSGSDDQQSVSSGKSRKQVLSTKLLKPFQNMRIRKKSAT